jgi:type 1 glutamine amidotransferase
MLSAPTISRFGRKLSPALLVLMTWASLSTLPARAGESSAFRALVFTKTTVFRHTSIPNGIAALEKLARENGFQAEITEDESVFATNNLPRYQVVVFLNNCGSLLNAGQRAAFQQYIRAGGGFAGIHCPIDCEKDWDWFTQLLGTRFLSHPAVMPGTVVVEDATNPSTAHLPERWTRVDEWYSFKPNPRGRVRVLMTLDEKSYTGGAMGSDHPIAWCHQFEGGRIWYTALGHTEECYEDPLFLQHILGGIQVAAGVKQAEFAPQPARPTSLRVR